MREFEIEQWIDDTKGTVIKEVQDALLMGAKYKELYERLLWEKNILISCLCSGRTDVIGIDSNEGQTTYHVRVKAIDSDEEAVWGMDNGKIDENYSCLSPASAVQWMLTEMKKWEETK